MTVDETYPCPKCGQKSLVYDGWLAWRSGERPPRNLARKDVFTSPRGDYEVERIYHCAQCGVEFWEDTEIRRGVHLWEEGVSRKYEYDASRGWYVGYGKPDPNLSDQAAPGESGSPAMAPLPYLPYKKPAAVQAPALPKPVEKAAAVQAPAPSKPVEQPAATQAPALSKPAGPAAATTIELVPGQLSVRLYQHTIVYQTPVPCWTYVTQGLWAFGQKELVITLRQDENMAHSGQTPDFPLRLIKVVFDLAKTGRLVNAGEYTSLKLTDAQQKIGIPFNMLYLPPLPLVGVPFPEQALTVRLMRAEEMQVYQAFGAMRLASSWAYHWRFFPYPPWSEMPAPDVVALPRFQSSILNKTARFHAAWSTVCLENNEVAWTLLSPVNASLVENLAKLPPEQPAAFLPGFDPRADACLAWLPEKSQIAMNVPPGSKQSRLEACFLLFIPAQQVVSIKIFEDGFAIMLPTETWLQVREALLKGQSIQVPSPGWSFRLENHPLPV